MADREKLIELLYENNVRCDQKIEGLADDILDLIANGVTFATDNHVGDKSTPTGKDNNVPSKWIPVTERLPEEDVLVLCIGAKGGMFLGYPRFVYKDDGFAYTRVPNARGSRHATHWMPLPSTEGLE